MLDEAEELRKRAEAGLTRRLAGAGLAPGHTQDEYRERLAFELGVISGMKYPGYFLIVADFIQWAKKQGIPVGPGRGSGAGSLVSYALTITDLDPIRFGLLFERFLNPERVSMPDFDIDFCQDRRDEVIRYVQERYGRDQVAQIITFGTLQARGVLRDVGRVLQMPYGQVDKLCKLVPQNPASPVTLAQAIEGEPRLQAERDGDPVVKRAFDIARKLEGLNRHASTHAAGIVIGDRALTELVPLYRDPKSDMPVTQFNMKWVEQAGLVKFDFLGLKTLTVLQTRGGAGETARHRYRPHQYPARRQGKPTTCWRAPKRSACSNWKAPACAARCSTCGPTVSRTSSRWSRSIGPVRWRISRPIARASTAWSSPTTSIPSLKPILKETFGVIIYQEQVMQAAQILAGFSLGEADLLRRAMGKKIRKEMQAQRRRFVEGAVERGVERYQADAIFDLLERFAEYGFNKSHAAAYALVAYQTAYMKANFPVEFMAASMTLDMGNTDKLAEFRAEAERLGIKVDPPSINRSSVAFEVGGQHHHLCAGRAQRRRQAGGGSHHRGARRAPVRRPCRLCRPHQSARHQQARAGKPDCRRRFRRVRAKPRARLSRGRRNPGRSQRAHDTAAVGQSELFGGGGAREPIALTNVEPWLPAERLRREYEAVGFFLSGHPLDDYANVLKKMRVQSWAEFSRAVKNGVTAGRVAGTVVSRTERRTRTGSKMGIIGLSDPTGHYEAVIFSEGLAEHRDLLEPGTSVLLFLSAEVQGDEVRARIQSVEPLDAAAANLQQGLRVFLRDAKPLEGLTKRLEPAPRSGPSNGDGEVSVVLMLERGTEVEVKLPGRFKVSPQIAGAIKAVPGVVQVEAL